MNALSDEQKEEINEAVSLEDLLEWNYMRFNAMFVGEYADLDE